MEKEIDVKQLAYDLGHASIHNGNFTFDEYSLQQFANQVIEKCAKVCEKYRDLPAGYSALEIRALKG